MLKGKVALVTGAGRGIGREIALALAGEGAFVAVNYNGSEQSAKEVVELIKSQGGNAKAYQCNVSDYEASQKMINEIIEDNQRLDILVNNAGITKDNLLMKMSEDDFDKVIDINLKGTFNCIKHISRHMLKQRSGKIINISSVSGVLGNAGQANYSASKAGVIGLTKSAARELAKRGITVNAIAPGFINTDMTECLSDSVKEGAVAQVPLGRFGEAKEVAQLAVFLASDKADYITGQVISVDGGMAM